MGTSKTGRPRAGALTGFSAFGLVLALVVIRGALSLDGSGQAAPPVASERRLSCAPGELVVRMVAHRTAVPTAGAAGESAGAALTGFLAADYPGLDARTFRAVFRSTGRVQFELRRAGGAQMFVDVDTVPGAWSVAQMSACNGVLAANGGDSR